MDKLQVQALKEITWCDHLTRHPAGGKSTAAFCRAFTSQLLRTE